MRSHMSLRNKIFLALLIITLPVIIVAFQNIGTIETFIRTSPGFSDQAGLLLEELLVIESKIEKLGMKMSFGLPEAESRYNQILSEVRASFSIVENLLSTQSVHYPEVETIRQSIENFAHIIERCYPTCAGEALTIQKEQSLLDEGAESLIRKSLTTITGDYRILKDRIEQGNTRGEWSLLALLVLLLGGSYFLAEGLTSRIVSLEKATQGVLNGDLSVPLPAPSRDEIGELIRAFEEMRAKLTHSMVTRRYLETLLNELGEGVIVTNESGEIEVANPAACTLLEGALDQRSSVQYSTQIHTCFTLQPENSPVTITTRDNKKRLITVTSAPLIDGDR